MEKDKSKLSARFIGISSMICAAVIIAAAIAGFCIPKSDNAALRGLDALHKSDKTYLAVKSENGNERLKTESLKKKLEEKQKELDEFKKSQDNLDKITESNAALEEEKNALQEEIKQKEKELAELEVSAKAYANKIVTWASGDYTVGKDIAAGKYTITGTGSIAIANKGKSKANKLLKADGESFTLLEGDLIHIDGNAKIVPQ